MKPYFESLLVANRGEIARRIIRTANRLGIRTIAVCSEADQGAPFTKEADECHVIGPPPPKESYLNVEKLLAVAKSTGAKAIHPGYGFLSENAAFARAVEAAGIAFVGPTPQTMEAVGNKISARALAEKAAVPVVPGSPRLEDLEQAKSEAEKIGYPVMLKAAAGGGGIGMTVVRKPEKLERAFEDAQKKGATFFGDDSVFVEAYIESPAHIEVQLLGDGNGQVVALGERDCTVQRRHQKVLEETPSPRLTEVQREEILAAAVRIGRACDYRNAGTVEMIFGGAGPHAGKFFFLEVNARLQVEHPVTEEVFGIDLVEHQLAIAAGVPKLDALAGLKPSGHALEARICAEDPNKRFFPSPGTLTEVRFGTGEGVRVDSAVESGSDVPPYYDSLLAKLIVHAPTREEACAKLKAAAEDSALVGIQTNLELFPEIVGNEVFRKGEHHTGFLKDVLGYKS